MDTQLVSHLAISQRRAALTFIDLQEYLRVGATISGGFSLAYQASQLCTFAG